MLWPAARHQDAGRNAEPVLSRAVGATRGEISSAGERIVIPLVVKLQVNSCLRWADRDVTESRGRGEIKVCQARVSEVVGLGRLGGVNRLAGIEPGERSQE